MLQWERDHTDATGLLYGAVAVTESEEPRPEVLPWPAMVNLEIEAGTILADDARAFALLLLAAADVADAANERTYEQIEERRATHA